MRVVHDNFVNLRAKAGELVLPVQNGEELNTGLSCVTSTQDDMSPNIHQVLLS